MTENPNVESQGAGGNQPPASGEAVAGKPDLSELVKVVRDVVSEELKPVKGEISGIYSRQDKDRNAFREFMDEYRKQKATGLSDVEAQNAAEQTLNAKAENAEEKRMLKEVYAKVIGSSSPQAAGNGVSGAVDLAKAVAKYDLSESDPDVIEASRGKSGDALDASLANLALKRAKQNPPSVAAASALQSGVGGKSDDVAALTEKYQKDMLAARGNKLLLKSIKEEAKKKGVPVDTIVFV